MVAFAATAAGAQQPTSVSSQTGVFSGTYLDGTQKLLVQAKATGRDYDVWVQLPRSYGREKRAYPLLLAMDGAEQFAVAAEAARLVNDDGGAAEMIVAAVATRGSELDQEVRRLWDYTPETTPPAMEERTKPYLKAMFARRGMSEARWNQVAASKLYGGAPEFLRFISDELLPLLEQRYRVDVGALGLAGHSAAGAFVTYALIKGSPFTRYLIGSYTAGWYGDQLPQLEAAFAQRPDKRPLQIYIAFGALEAQQLKELKAAQGDYERSNGLLDTLAASRTGLITVTHEMIAGQGHLGMVPALYAAGIRTLFPPEKPR
jgi:predicted alpha/beta superfamily hydrolase